MRSVSRRSFLTTAALAAAASTLPARGLFAAESAPLIGLQLYSARNALARDFPGTLKRIAAIGYREVEAAGFYNHSASDVKQMMADAGLHCVSAHYSLADLLKSTDAIIAYAKTLGLEYVICSAPWAANPAHLENYPGGSWQGILHAMTLDDWKWNAEQFNQMGRKMQEAGLKFGYHNHTMEFRPESGSTGYRILLLDTDPRCVTLELDCGWAIAAGQDPAKMLRLHPGRFSMLHLKDLTAAPAATDPSDRVSTEIGYGVVDYRPIFEAAKVSGIRHYFVEQEDFDKPVFQALTIDFKNSNILARGGRLHPA
ncbi:MAG TPA: sugar phosphate isomerase/epimerase [Acidobacteriaceae bacterium]|nr:sugar phosphate isomerase/epimerase [Acidobacteriaceae bacterium]